MPCEIHQNPSHIKSPMSRLPTCSGAISNPGYPPHKSPLDLHRFEGSTMKLKLLIKGTNRLIYQMVYRLYGLNEDEVRVVEEKSYNEGKSI